MDPVAVVPFSPYQKQVVAILAFLQFTVILDFMIISPLGATMMPALGISATQFGLIVSVYAFSAGAAGLLAAGFADQFDRKRLLLFFYVGFLLGTLLCGIAPTYQFLLGARFVTGVFGGVIGSTVFAITTDLFAPTMRGRVMGFVQTAFAASQILGLPAGLYFSNLWGWHAPFLMIVVVGAAVGVIIWLKLKPIDAHLKLTPKQNALTHLWRTISTPRYLNGFATTALLSMGGFMLMPFGSAFTVHNLGIALDKLPLIYLVSGCCSIFTGPLVGRAADRFGNVPIFTFGTALGVIMALIYTNLGVTPLWLVIVVNATMFVGVFSRMIPAQALMAGVPTPESRGAYSAISSSMQQIAGGIGSIVAGVIVLRRADGSLEHFEKVGYVLVATSLIAWVMIYRINRIIGSRPSTG